jgi:hypothetical protein
VCLGGAVLEALSPPVLEPSEVPGRGHDSHPHNLFVSLTFVSLTSIDR